MATICPYQGRKCRECPHNKWDDDRQRMACFVKQDLSPEEYQKSQLEAWERILAKKEK
jgi:hypothetical protein